jgi:hypothetical protein
MKLKEIRTIAKSRGINSGGLAKTEFKDGMISVTLPRFEKARSKAIHVPVS